MTQVATDLNQPPTSPDHHRSRYGWLLGRELTILLTGFMLYRFVRLIVKDEIDRALVNSNTVVDWERALGIFNEVDLQSTILDSDLIVWSLNRYYFFAHFIGSAAFLIWLYVRHFDHYGRVRRVMFGVTFIALAVHVVFPLAPPRWFPHMGFVDTLQTYGPKIYDSETITNTANQIAAMPSLHVAWALIGAWAVIRASRSVWRWLAIAHPVVMTAAVVLTANHWWLDAFVAAALVMLVVTVDLPIQRRLELRKQRRGAVPASLAAE